jgi:hypothetical protein
MEYSITCDGSSIIHDCGRLCKMDRTSGATGRVEVNYTEGIDLTGPGYASNHDEQPFEHTQEVSSIVLCSDEIYSLHNVRQPDLSLSIVVRQ